jgi:hypothetical protein
MIRINDIQSKLFHLVGWGQSLNPQKAIDEGLTESESGLMFQDVHPLLTLDNIESIVPEDFMYIYPRWNDEAEYVEGTKVKHEGEVWIALVDNVNVEPSDETLDTWGRYSYLSDYLTRITKAGITKAVQTFLRMKKLNYETRELFDRKTFFDGAARLKATIPSTHKLVGMEIIPVRAMGVTMQIHRIGLQMVGAIGKIKMYLFHSSQGAPIKTFELDFTNTSGGFQWFDVKDLYLPYISDGTDAGGAWFLCYNQDELPFGMEALNVSKDWSKEPCGTCNIGSIEVWRELTKYVQVSPFCYPAPEGFAEHPLMWDIERTIYTNTMNYGINCELSIGCDLTDFIIEQRGIFAEVIQKQVAADALRTMAMNPEVRVNRNQSNVSRLDILYELDGNTQSSKPQGLGQDLRRAYEALSIETKGLDRICLKCHNGGVKYRTA